MEATSRPARLPEPASEPGGAPERSFGPPLTTSIDLDGDAIDETVVFSTATEGVVSPAVASAAAEADERPKLWSGICPAERCTLTVSVVGHPGAVQFSAPLGWDIAVETIDIDRRSPKREILVRSRAEETEDPPYVFTVVDLGPNGPRAQPLWHGWGYSAGRIWVPGDGRVITEYDECPELVTTTYRERDGLLVEVARRKLSSHGRVCAG